MRKISKKILVMVLCVAIVTGAFGGALLVINEAKAATTTGYKVTIVVKNGNNDIEIPTNNNIKSGNSYSGIQTLYVKCKDICRVYVTTDNNNYTRQSGSSSDENTYRYALTIDRKMTLVVVKMGDINFDGNVDSADALLILRYDVDKADLNDLQKKNGDINLDGKTDSADALMILRYDVNKAKFVCN